jgi:hypothetical protein
MRKRPVAKILGYKTPGGDHELPKPPTPQLTGPATTSTETRSAPAKMQPADNWRPPQSNPTPTPASAPASAPQQAQPKPAVNLANETLSTMGDIKPMTTAEIMDDEIPW